MKILHIDDQADAAWIQQALIFGAAGTPVEFVNATEAPSDPAVYDDFDGVIVDLCLGKNSGIDVCADIHRRNWRQPIMVLTIAERKVALETLALEAGAWFMCSKDAGIHTKATARRFLACCAIRRQLRSVIT